MKNLIIKPSEHVLIVGTTGSGKSYFAEHYLANYDYVIKLDTKNEYAERKMMGLNPWAGLVEGKDFTYINNLADISNVNTPKIIYAPALEELNEDFFDEFFRFCFLRQNTIVWVDELMSVVSAQRLPPWLLYIVTQGRSKNVALWACSQRPTGIPMIIPANTTHYITYYLNWLEDRKKMYAFTGCPEVLQPPNKANYEFWYSKSGHERAVKARLKV